MGNRTSTFIGVLVCDFPFESQCPEDTYIINGNPCNQTKTVRSIDIYIAKALESLQSVILFRTFLKR